MSKIRIQLNINESRGMYAANAVSKKFHIYFDDKSLCGKYNQDTNWYETDLNEKIKNYENLPTEDFVKILNENKENICGKCLKLCLKYLNVKQSQNNGIENQRI